MTQQTPFDLGTIIEGIRAWVEIESPTAITAAVNRMIDRVQADLAGVPVTIERIARPRRPCRHPDRRAARAPASGPAS